MKQSSGFPWPLAFVIVLLLIAAVLSPGQQTAREMTAAEHQGFRDAMFTPGTRYMVGRMISEDGRRQSGTIVDANGKRFVVTTAHFFHATTNVAYWFVYTDINGWHTTNYCSKVLRHPHKGLLGETDLAICLLGEKAVIHGFSTIESNSVLTNVHVKTLEKEAPLELLHLHSGKIVRVVGLFHTAPNRQVFAADFPVVDGMSGGGLIGNEEFFVISGNIPEATADVSEILGIPRERIALLTRL